MANARPETPTVVLLRQIGEGDRQAADDLLPLVYDELRRLARAQLRHERPGQTITPTGLVHEAYLRLVQGHDPGWDGRGHFFAAAAEAMRRILVDRARRRAALKRGADPERVSLSEVTLGEETPPETILAIDQALARLEQKDGEMAKVVKLRYFAGLTVEETASTLTLSERSVNRYWTGARAWLARELGTPPP
ncbi:MAG: ECF-type sigma factor [Thermoanaerobaculia bacterium]